MTEPDPNAPTLGTMLGVWAHPDDETYLAAELIEAVQPDSVLTFGPDGMTDHPDHKAVCAWTTEAFGRAGKPGSRLYYATMTPDWAERFVERMNRFNVFMGPNVPPVTLREEI